MIRRVPAGRRAVPFTVRTDRAYRICPITDGKLYVYVPTFEHLLGLLSSRRWRSNAHLTTIAGYVPYFGGAIAFHAENLLLKGVKPLWSPRETPGWADRTIYRRNRALAIQQLLADGVYASRSEAESLSTGYPRECEWFGPRGFRFEPEDIAEVWAWGGPLNPVDLRSKKGRLLRSLVPEGVPIRKGMPQRVGQDCRRPW